MNGLFEWVLFLALSLVAITTAAGMLITMSMYRAGLALMASLVALAGLFLLLDADLLAAIQLMMNVGGMLVMILFMVMIMMDPGGEMMWGMKRDMHIRGLGAFSMTMPRGKAPADNDAQETDTHQTQNWTCPMHLEVSQDHPGTCPKCGMQLIPQSGTNERDKLPQHPQLYTCLMHPDIEQDHPGTCPKCGMHLVPKAEKIQKQTSSEGQSMQSTSSHEMMDHSMMDMPPEEEKVDEQNAGEGQNMMDHSTMDMPAKEGKTNEQNADEEQNMQSTSSHEMMDHSTMDMSHMSAGQNDQMMVDMAMSTAQLPWALLLGALSAIFLIVLVIMTPWPVAHTGPTQDAVTMVGNLLLSRYMIGFEGAAFLILAGIAGAVILAKREHTLMQSQEHAQHMDTAEKADASAPVSMSMTYTCPMHSDIRQKQPGNCPLCGMQLTPTAETEAAMQTDAQGGPV